MGNSISYKKFVTNADKSALTIAIENKKYDTLAKILDYNTKNGISSYDVVCDSINWSCKSSTFFYDYMCYSEPDFYYDLNVNALQNIISEKLNICDANRFLEKLKGHPLICAISQNDILALEMMLKSNTILLTGFELFLACKTGNIEIVKLFLEYTHPNQVLIIRYLFEKECCAITLYDYVSALGKLNLVELLINHGVRTSEAKTYKPHESTFTYVFVKNTFRCIVYDNS